mmetsp:Transcript_24618/g.41133  ORF Transcript_24618/g.41133 Transcript_24618/m.41133 type:complete len:702 (-) Transcript_24618:253-2358(-)|eukprot:CAMPEP_0198199786 /NCGR_PEP_ID=MMETSP1445-20131203/2949_1 /TAXON_ID=36898 /ORGANISM="Pyramimonas sp., Strain CCMP2087" /LENGTH=701 /DNA_ID=CAMNT_0043869681 /DNA_START=93 /DNA_END=2198 /DNA_ORIENTATION=-
MENIENTGAAPVLRVKVPTLDLAASFKSVNSPSRKPFSDIASHLNSPSTRSSDDAKAPVKPAENENALEGDDHEEMQGVRAASEAEAKEVEALQKVQEHLDGKSPSPLKSTEQAEDAEELSTMPTSEAEVEEGYESEEDDDLDEGDLEDVIEFLTDKLDFAEQRNDQLEETVYMMQIEEGKWGAEQNAMFNSIDALQCELVKTRAQLSWAMRQLFNKIDAAKVVEAGATQDEAAEAVGTQAEATEEGATEEGVTEEKIPDIVLDEDQDAEDVGELLMMISDLEEQVFGERQARAYMESQCRKMMLHMDYMAAEIAEARAEKAQMAEAEEAQMKEVPSHEEAQKTLLEKTDKTAMLEEQCNVLEGELNNLNEECTPLSPEEETTVEEEKVVEKEKEEKEAAAEHESLETAHQRALYSHCQLLEDELNAMGNHLEVVHWQRDIYASECSYLRDYCHQLQSQVVHLQCHLEHQEKHMEEEEPQTQAATVSEAQATEETKVKGAEGEVEEVEVEEAAGEKATAEGLECDEQLNEEEEEVLPMSIVEYVQFENTMLKCHVNELLDRVQDLDLDNSTLVDECEFFQGQNQALVDEWQELKREADAMIELEQARSQCMEDRLCAAEAHLEAIAAAGGYVLRADEAESQEEEDEDAESQEENDEAVDDEAEEAESQEEEEGKEGSAQAEVEIETSSLESQQVQPESLSA